LGGVRQEELLFEKRSKRILVSLAALKEEGALRRYSPSCILSGARLNGGFLLLFFKKELLAFGL
jgi:hypothetical protein